MNTNFPPEPTPLVQQNSPLHPAASGAGNDKERPDLEVLTTVFYYCFTIIVLPVFTFFAAKYLLFSGVFGVESVSSNVYSAVASIIVVHISLAMFIKRAYSEASSGGNKPQKQD